MNISRLFRAACPVLLIVGSSCSGNGGSNGNPSVTPSYIGTYSGVVKLSHVGTSFEVQENRSVEIKSSATSGKYILTAPGTFAGSYTIDIANDSFYIGKVNAGTLQGKDIFDWGGGKFIGNTLRINFFQELTGVVTANAVGTIDKK